MTSILAFFILICVLVFVHEYGHFWAARRCGVRVLRFSIGFGKVLWKRTDKYGTEFAFSLIPLGGYVQMYNGEPEWDIPDTQALKAKSVLQRAFIVLAGPIANFLFAIVAYWAVLSIGIPTVKPVIGSIVPQSIAAKAKLIPELHIQQVDGADVQDWEETALALVSKVGSAQVEVRGNIIDEDFSRTFYLDLSDWEINSNLENPLTQLGIQPKKAVVEPMLKNVVENSPAEKVGLKANDKILMVNNQPFDWLFLLKQVQTGEPLELTVERNGLTLDFVVQPQKSEKENRYIIGLVPYYQPLADKYLTELKYDMLTALQKSIYKVGKLIKTTLQFIANLLTGDLSLKNMGGPISIAKSAGSTAEIGFIYYLSFMALISVNLGVMNLFPILPLDGGQLLLLIGEAVRGKPLSDKVYLRFQQFGVAFVLSLMAFALFNDLIHF